MVGGPAAGLLIDGAYRDPAAIEARLRAYDLVTLAVAAPLLALCLRPALRRSPRARLVAAAALAYTVYTYAFHIFEAAFNDIFLGHVALFSVSLFAFVLTVSCIDATAVARRFDARTPVRTVGGVLVVLAVSLAAMWVFYSLRFAVGGQAPQESLLVSTSAGIHIAYALDLGLLVPAYALAGVLLWRRAAWVYVLGGVLLVAGVLQQVGYMVALLFQAAGDVPGATAFDPAEPVIVLAYLAAAAALLGNLDRRRRPREASGVR